MRFQPAWVWWGDGATPTPVPPELLGELGMGSPGVRVGPGAGFNPPKGFREAERGISWIMPCLGRGEEDGAADNRRHGEAPPQAPFGCPRLVSPCPLAAGWVAHGGVCGYEALTLPPGHEDLDLGLGGAECRMGAEIF